MEDPVHHDTLQICNHQLYQRAEVADDNAGREVHASFGQLPHDAVDDGNGDSGCSEYSDEDGTENDDRGHYQRNRVVDHNDSRGVRGYSLDDYEDDNDHSKDENNSETKNPSSFPNCSDDDEGDSKLDATRPNHNHNPTPPIHISLNPSSSSFDILDKISNFSTTLLITSTPLLFFLASVIFYITCVSIITCSLCHLLGFSEPSLGTAIVVVVLLYLAKQVLSRLPQTLRKRKKEVVLLGGDWDHRGWFVGGEEWLD